MVASSIPLSIRASNSLQPAGGELERVGSPPPESIYEALIECVRAAGGSKTIAAQLWPARAARSIEDARRYLANCLSAERAEKLSLDEVSFILRAARSAGCHAGMQYLCASLDYAPPQPVAPADVADQLRRQVLAMGRELQVALARIEELGA